MDIILIMLISVAVFFVVQKISKATKIATPILYLIIGIIAGIILKAANLGTIVDVFPHINMYNSVVLLLMFFAAGFSVNVNQIKKSGKMTAKLFSIPAYVETILVTIILFLLLQVGGGTIGIELTFAESLMIAAILAVASPANIVPTSVGLMQTGYTDKNNLPATMLAVSVVDGFITVPVVLVALIIAMAAHSGKHMGGLTLVLIAVGVLVALVLMIAFGILVGRIILAIINPIFKKIAADPSNKKLPFVGIIVAFLLAGGLMVGLSMIPGLGMLFGVCGILVICVVGATIKHCDKNNVGMAVSQKGNMLFGIFGMPVVFMFVGARMDLGVLLNPAMLLIGAATCVLGFIIKGLTTMFILRDKQYTDGERKFAAACFIPKGVTLINFGVAFLPILSASGMTYVTDFMTMLAAITILITMTVGMTLLNRVPERWLFKAN